MRSSFFSKAMVLTVAISGALAIHSCQNQKTDPLSSAITGNISVQERGGDVAILAQKILSDPSYQSLRSDFYTFIDALSEQTGNFSGAQLEGFSNDLNGVETSEQLRALFTSYRINNASELVAAANHIVAASDNVFVDYLEDFLLLSSEEKTALCNLVLSDGSYNPCCDAYSSAMREAMQPVLNATWISFFNGNNTRLGYVTNVVRIYSQSMAAVHHAQSTYGVCCE